MIALYLVASDEQLITNKKPMIVVIVADNNHEIIRFNYIDQNKIYRQH